MPVSGTSIFEMREMVDETEFDLPVEELIRPDAVEQWPFRDYDKLAEAADGAENISEIVAEMDASWHAIETWLDAYGFDVPGQKQQTTAHSLSQMSPDVVGDD